MYYCYNNYLKIDNREIKLLFVKEFFNTTIMKSLYSFILILGFAMTAFTQNGFYVKYDINIVANDEGSEMFVMVMKDSYIEIASNADRNWTKNSYAFGFNEKEENNF